MLVQNLGGTNALNAIQRLAVGIDLDRRPSRHGSHSNHALRSFTLGCHLFNAGVYSVQHHRVE